MHLGLELFMTDAITRQFIDSMDMSSAEHLISDCKAMGAYDLSKELMCNRKFTVRHCLLQALEHSPKPAQVVILAAGKSPLGLEAYAHSAKKISRIFEVDIAPFGAKPALYNGLLPASKNHVAFIEHDVASPRLIAALQQEGFDPAVPSVVVLEGITHYLAHDACRKVLALFASKPVHNMVVFEYGPPFEGMTDWVRPIAMAAYRGTENRYHPGMTKYTPEWIGETFRQLGGKLVHVFHMNEMERLRTGANRFFKEPNSGWVEVATGKL